MELPSNQSFLLSLCVLLLLTWTSECTRAISTIHCEKVAKYPKRFDLIPELEFLGMQSFCQILLLDCNVIFQKTKFDKVSMYAYTNCDDVHIDFSVTNSSTNDIFKVIVPSIDFEGQYTISFISENNFLKRKNMLLETLLKKDTKKQHKMIERTYRKKKDGKINI